MSVEDVSVIFNLKIMQGLDYTQVQYWGGDECGEKCGKEQEFFRSHGLIDWSHWTTLIFEWQ